MVLHFLHYWYLFPLSILIATTAMASGVGGATFFSPLFIIGLRLSPEVAVGIALLTEVFGFASGLFAYLRQKLVDFRLGLALLTATIPAALVGTWLAGQIAPDFLKLILGVGLFMVATSFLRTPTPETVKTTDQLIADEAHKVAPETCLVAANGEEITYTVCNKQEGRLIAGVGGLFVGLISTGLGEMNGYFLLQRCRVPSKVSVATSVFVVAVTALIASAGHLVQFVQTGADTLNTVLGVALFTVPGVVIGGQLGSRVARFIPQSILERSLGILFIIIAVITVGEVVL